MAMIRVWMILVAVLLSACGSSSPTGGVATASGSTAVVTGSVVAGTVNNGIVTATLGAGQSRTAFVHGDSFQLTVPLAWLASPLAFSVTGNYRDEVSGQSVSLQNSPLQLHTTANSLASAGGHVAITPDSTLIALLVQQGMTDASANQLFQSQFGYTPVLNAHPFDPYATMPAQAAGLMAA
ncbi:MAG: hypothetical protein Q9M09_06575, partial [Mariprofundaceae bacterium]|nr:hypothetical protein [Mariprofundaceae bacterium]